MRQSGKQGATPDTTMLTIRISAGSLFLTFAYQCAVAQQRCARFSSELCHCMYVASSLAVFQIEIVGLLK